MFMKKLVLLLSLLLLPRAIIFTQSITLEDIWSWKYYPESVSGFVSFKDGKHYTINEGNRIAKYSYQNQSLVEVLYSGRYSNFTFDSSETKILIQLTSQKIYRHSNKGAFEVFDLKTKQKISIFDGKSIQVPTFSPDGNKVAFVFENNIYYQNLQNQSITQVTNDGKMNAILNGICDWVYEEEFGFVRHYEWSTDSSKILFVKLDETAVPEVYLPIYGKSLYPTEMRFKYPKAGENNSIPSLYYFDLNNQKSWPITLNGVENYYIVKLVAFPNNDFVVITSNRHQNKLDVSRIDTENLSLKKIFTETDSAWIETDHLDIIPLQNGDFIWSSERNGYKHLYLYAAPKYQPKQITSGIWEVTKVYGVDEKTMRVFYQSTENGSINRGIYAVNYTNGRKYPIAVESGINDAEFSSDFSYLIHQHSTKNSAPKYVLRDISGKEISVLASNNKLTEKAKTLPQVEFMEISNAAGDKMNAWMIKPKDFSPQKKYPVLMYVYGGPGSQEAKNEWEPMYYWWFQMLAEKGYIIFCADGRGTGAKGAKFKKSIYKQLGKLEIDDQIAAAKYLQQLPFVASNRIGIFGWSFGGYVTSLALTKGAETFALGVAVAPVTNWRFYDTIYTERFLQTPQENPTGYDENSPVNFAQLLKGKYLLIHGSADDNVHVQNSFVMSEALVQKNKPFEYMIYTDKNHGIFGGNTRLHLFSKITEFIYNNL